MKRLCIGTAVFGAALIGFPLLGHAQMAVDIGKREYALSCAICHGDRGKGDGSLVEYLKKRPADLQKFRRTTAVYFLLAGFTRSSTVGNRSALTDCAKCQYGEASIATTRWNYSADLA